MLDPIFLKISQMKKQWTLNTFQILVRAKIVVNKQWTEKLRLAMLQQVAASMSIITYKITKADVDIAKSGK